MHYPASAKVVLSHSTPINYHLCLTRAYCLWVSDLTTKLDGDRNAVKHFIATKLRGGELCVLCAPSPWNPGWAAPGTLVSNHGAQGPPS